MGILDFLSSISAAFEHQPAEGPEQWNATVYENNTTIMQPGEQHGSVQPTPEFTPSINFNPPEAPSTSNASVSWIDD